VKLQFKDFNEILFKNNDFEEKEGEGYDDPLSSL